MKTKIVSAENILYLLWLMGRLADIGWAIQGWGLVGHVAEQVGDALAVVGAADRLGKHHAHVDTLNFVAVLHGLVLAERVGHNHSLKPGKLI